MNQTEIQEILQKLLNLTTETELVEFKEAKSSYPFDKIGKYFSALSNEANLKGKECAWLIFGVADNNHSIVGTNYRKDNHSLNYLKKEVADKTTNRITFIEIYDLKVELKRVLMFQIPAAPRGLPIAWEGHYYGRDHESLSPLNLEEIERIRAQAVKEDWSSVVIHESTIEDLDESAIEVARENFKKKFPGKSSEVDVWDDITFLNKAKITIKGKITRTAILLLGKEESEHFLSPSVVKNSLVTKGF